MSPECLPRHPAVAYLFLVRPMKPLVTSLLFLTLATAHAAPGWESKVIANIRVEVPTDCQTDVQNTPGAGGTVQSMKKYSLPQSCA